MAEGRILVCDDDVESVKLIEVRLKMEGFEVLPTYSAEQALQKALEAQPDLIIMDVVMRPMSGYEAFAILRQMPKTSSIPIIMVSGIRTEDQDLIEGFETGADDYITKPFNPSELVARVKGMLARARRYREFNPLTGLPGNAVIKHNLNLAVESGKPFAFLYVDLDNFKGFNDKYGFQRGDEVIRAVSQILCDGVEKCCRLRDFLGHVGGDDFVVLTSPDSAEMIAHYIVAEFDRRVMEFYPPHDRERGSIEIIDRRGQIVDCPFMTISIGIATNQRRAFLNALEVTEAAAEVKQIAKACSGSAYFEDRRSDTAK